MFEQRDWVVACLDCKTLINIQEDRCQNLIDHKYEIIPRCYEALQELVDTSREVKIHFSLIDQIKSFVDNHKDHQLKSGPIIEKKEYEGFTINTPKKNSAKELTFTCTACSKATGPLTIEQSEHIEQKQFTIKDLEHFYTILELYNSLGMRIKNHQQALDLEKLLPFLKTHVIHKIMYKTA